MLAVGMLRTTRQIVECKQCGEMMIEGKCLVCGDYES